MNLIALSEPFPAEDIEWRVSRAGVANGKLWCSVLAYITARAIEERLDSVCGQANWRNEEPRIFEIQGAKETRSAFAVGLSIRINDEWITKWDVAEPTNIEPAKGGFSGAMKRAGQQWGIGRYLYRLDEVFADTSEEPMKGNRLWNWAKLPEKQGGGTYYWKTPGLPAWAMPKDKELEVTAEELTALKQSWRAKFAPETKNPKDLLEGFARFVTGVVGEFPSADFKCWTRDALERCQKRITETNDPGGPSSDVPFE